MNKLFKKLKKLKDYMSLSKDFIPLENNNLDVNVLSKWVLLRCMKDLGESATLEEAFDYYKEKETAWRN